MAVIKGHVQFVVVNMCDPETVCVLGAKIDIPLHESVFIQFEFKRIQVLVSGPQIIFCI